MRTYVEIVGEAVVNRIISEDALPLEWFDEQGGLWVEHDEAQIGWTYDGKAFSAPPPPPRPDPVPRRVPKSVIVGRLYKIGKLAAAKQAIDSNLYVRERWYAADQPAVNADDPETLGLLSAIEADAEYVLKEGTEI